MSVASLPSPASLSRLQAGICPRQGSNFLLLRQKKVTKEKASRRQGPCGLPSAARSEGEPRKLALRAQTCTALDPLAPVLLGPANGIKDQQPNQDAPWRVLAEFGICFPLPCGCAEKRSGRRIKRRACLSAASLRGSRLARASQVAPAQPGSQSPGSPFFWVLCFGEAKKSTSPAGARPGKASYASAISEAHTRPGAHPDTQPCKACNPKEESQTC